MNKRCFKCGNVLPLSEFYQHKMMADGHLNKCKSCAKRDVHTYHVNNRDKTARLSRDWKRRHPASRLKSNAVQGAKPHARERRAVNWAAWSAYKRGDIEKPSACSQCGATGRRITMHHDDYSRPLDVRWLCGTCHLDADRERVNSTVLRERT